MSGIANGLGVEVHSLFLEAGTPPENRNLLERFKKDITRNVLDALESAYRAYGE